VVTASLQVSLAAIRGGEVWEVCDAPLTFHAVADQAGCRTGRTVVPASADRFTARASAMLEQHASLSRTSPTRVRIVPKTDFAACGITICSISRYLALFYESVELRWRRVETRTPAVPGCGYNIVLLPWSLKVSASDFHLVKSAVGHVDSEVFGFFEFAPRVWLNPGNVSAPLSLACAEFGMIDAVIFARGCRTAARGQRPGIRPRRVRGEVPDRRRTAPSKGWRLRWQLSPLRCSNAGRLAATSAGQAPPF
jgi:hypothetical protein